MYACHPFSVVAGQHRCRAASSQLSFSRSVRILGRTVVICVILFSACTASASTMTGDRYLKDKIAFTNFHISWLDGVFNGLKGANSELQRTNRPPLFCPPPHFSMTAQQVNSFFDKFVTNNKGNVRTSDPIGILLLEALQEAYPCPR